MITLLYTGALMGLGATVLIDLWALVLQRLARVPLPNWAMVGRWVMHLPRGRLFHENIAAAQPMPKERQIGWVFHYFVGVVYGVFSHFWLVPIGFLHQHFCQFSSTRF